MRVLAEVLWTSFLSKLGKNGKRLLASVFIYSQVFPLIAMAALPNLPGHPTPAPTEAASSPPISALPYIGPFSPVLNWAQTGTLPDFSLNNQQFSVSGPLSVGVTYNHLTGLFFGAQYILSLAEQLALGFIGEYGTGQYRLNGTVGYGFSPLAQVKLTGEYLEQRLPFQFDSGDISQRVHQDAYGIRFQQLFEQPLLQAINFGGYYARAADKDLSPVIFTSNGSNCDGLVGLSCINYRRIAGATSSGLDAGTELLITPSTLLSGNLYYDKVYYHTALTGDSSHDSDGLGGSLGLKQLLGDSLKLWGEASLRKVYNNYEGGLSWLPVAKRWGIELSLTGQYLVSHNTTPNNNSVSLQVKWSPDGSTGYDKRFEWGNKHLPGIAQWIQTPAVYMKQVLAIAEQITHVLAPTITNINPNSGPFEGGNVVTITGINFVSGVQVFFAGQLATAISVLSSTMLTVVVPGVTPSATPLVVDVVVQNPNGQQSTFVNGYTYSAAPIPTISSVIPDEGSVSGGTNVMITGTGFTDATMVTFGGIPATFVVISDTEINVITPGGPTEGPVDVVVTTPGGSVTGTGDFTYSNAALFTSTPGSVIKDVGQTATFSTMTSGGVFPYTYQWQVSVGGGPFSPISGATTNTYTITTLTSDENGNQYRVIVTDNIDDSVTSGAAILTVNATLATTAPESVTKTAGQTATFHTITSGGTQPYTYQWQVSTKGGAFAPIVGAPNEPSYTTPMLTTDDSGNQYRVMVTDAVNSTVTSGAATLTVNTALQTTAPEDAIQNAGQMAMFITTASGGTPTYTYKWQVSTDGGMNFTDVNTGTGYTTATYTTPMLATGNSGYQYQVLVTDMAGATVTSGVATLTVNPALTTSTPEDATQNAGQTATFNTTPSGGSKPYTYQWQVSTDGGMNFTDVDSGTGGDTDSYTTDILADMDTDNQYRVIVKDATDASVTSPAATLTINANLTTSTPSNVTVSVGRTATFSTEASDGTPPYFYQWQVSTNGGPFTDVDTGTGGDTARYTTDTLTNMDNGNQYQVIVTDSVSDTVTSGVATLTVNAALATTTPASVTKNAGQTASFHTTASGGIAPYHYQWQVSTNGGMSFSNINTGTGYTTATYTTPPLTTGNSGYQYRVVVMDAVTAVMSNAAILTVNPALQTTAPEDAIRNEGQMAMFTTTASGGTPTYTYKWQVSTNGGMTFTDVNTGTGYTTATYTTPMLATGNSGYQYQVIVTDTTGATVTSGIATLIVNSALTTTTPAPATQNAGQTATFNTMTSGGTQPYTYQWQVSIGGGAFNPISEAPNAPSYTTPILSTANSGNRYQVVVTDNTGATVTSGIAPLTVNSVLTTTPLTNQTHNVGQTATFSTTTSGGTQPYMYQWQVSMNGGAFSPISGATTNTYTITTLTPNENGNQYRVLVTDNTGETIATNAAILTVNPALTTTAPTSATQNVGQTAEFYTQTNGGSPAYTYTWQVSTDGGATFGPILGAPDAPSYMTPVLTTDYSGYQYQVIVSDATDAVVTSTPPAILTVNDALTTTAPADKTQNVGQTATFSTTTSGGTLPYLYQWQVSMNGGAFNNVTTGTGGDTDSYMTAALASSDANNQYRVIVTDNTGESIPSGAALLTVNAALTTSAPADATQNVGQKATFNTTPQGGTQPYTYQWQVSMNGGAFTNVTTGTGGDTDSYTTDTLVGMDANNQYRVIVKDATNASVTSPAATLTINANLTTSTPSNATVNAGQTATFSTVASDGTSPYTYQWQVSTNGGAFTNVTTGIGGMSAMYTTPPLTTGNTGNQYRVVVKDSVSDTVTSGAATVTVHTTLATTTPANAIQNAGQTASFHTTASGGTAPYTYQWQLSIDGGGTFTPISGAMASFYTTPTLAMGNSGYQYRVVVKDALSDTVTSGVATLTVNAALTTSRPADVTQPVGQTATFSTMTSGGTLPYTYKWQVSTNGGAFTDVNTGIGYTTATYTTPALTMGNNGNQYRVLVSDKTGETVPSNAAVLTVVALAIGDRFGGGTVACLTSGGGAANLIATVADTATNIAWGSTTIVTGATSRADGAGNTAKIVASQSGSAAGICAAYQVDSAGNSPCVAGNTCYNDWFLPAANQLTCLYQNRVAIGGFSTDNYIPYWSSTEVTVTNALVQIFTSAGSAYDAWKSNSTPFLVRCVRAFSP
jgi:hypothetical protein